MFTQFRVPIRRLNANIQTLGHYKISRTWSFNTIGYWLNHWSNDAYLRYNDAFLRHTQFSNFNHLKTVYKQDSRHLDPSNTFILLIKARAIFSVMWSNNNYLNAADQFQETM